MNLCHFKAGLDQRLFLIAGPCVIESRQMTIDIAGQLRDLCASLCLPFIFKASFDKANRSSVSAFRGLGRDDGLAVLAEVKKHIAVPVLTDVHESADVAAVASVVDVLQIPAFLCRQTDLIFSCARSGKPVNIKKGQFLAPREMQNVVTKARHAASEANLDPNRFLVCERGSCFGYHNLVVDMRSLAILRDTQAPVVFDATHSVQLPGLGESSGGERQYVPLLARAAVAVGVSGLFMETHPDPEHALSDGPNAIALKDMPALLETLLELDSHVKKTCVS